MVLWWFARGLTWEYRFCPLPRLSLALQTLSTVPAHWLHWLNTGGIIVWRFSGNPLAFGVYKPFLLGGSASGKLDASTAASSVRSSGGGHLMCLQPGPQRTSNVGTECCLVLQAFLRKPLERLVGGQITVRKRWSRGLWLLVTPPEIQGENPADHHFIPFLRFAFLLQLFFSYLVYGWKLPSVGQHDPGEVAYDCVRTVWETLFVVATIRFETLVGISSCLDRTKVQ